MIVALSVNGADGCGGSQVAAAFSGHGRSLKASICAGSCVE